MDREEVIERLIVMDRLWRLLDYNSCHFCAKPRKPEYAKNYRVCFDCKQLIQQYGGRSGGYLANLVPITYTTPEWPLGRGLRDFKDSYNASPSNIMAARFGAVLSAFLEAQLDELGAPWGFTHIIPVPSSKPTVVNAVQRAASEGWWTPQLHTDVVGSAPDFPRQRERPSSDRRTIEDKWTVDQEALSEDARVLLLDDLVTSGGSVHSLAAELRWAGASQVQAVVLARNLGADGSWVQPHLAQNQARGAVWTPHVMKRDIIKGDPS